MEEYNGWTFVIRVEEKPAGRWWVHIELYEPEGVARDRTPKELSSGPFGSRDEALEGGRQQVKKYVDQGGEAGRG